MSLRLPIIIILAVCSIKGHTQINNLRFVNFGSKDGLPDKIVYSAAQDKQGYMWFGTSTGLYRYDGHTFKIFRSPIDKPGRTISNILQSVFCDQSGNLWLGSLNTLQWYDPKKNKFWSPNLQQAEIKSLLDAYILNFTEDTNGDTWIATSNDHFFRFKQQDSSVHSFRNIFPANTSKTTIKIITSANNEHWAIHSEGIYQFSTEDKPSVFFPFKEDNISNAFADKDGRSIWLSTYGYGLIRFDCTEKKYETFDGVNQSLKKNNLFCIRKDQNDDIWIGSYPLFKINSVDHPPLVIENKRESEYDLAASKIGNLFFDREQNLWICSYNGLSMMPWQDQQVKKIWVKDSISGNSAEIVGVYELPGTRDLLLPNTTTSGLMYYDAARDKMLTIKNPFYTKGAQKNIISIIPDPANNIFVSDDVNFFKFMPQQKKLLPVTLADQDGKEMIRPGRNVFDAAGNVYISSISNGFYIWNTKTNQLRHYNKWDADKTADPKGDNVFYPCLVDHKNNTWFTSNTAVYKYDPAANKFYHYAYTENTGIPLLSSANYIAEDKLGHYWITTLNNGLYELYFENGKEVLKNYTKNNLTGLPTDYCLKIKPDLKDSSLWISTIVGIIKFDPIQKKVISILKKQNGLADDAIGYSFTITADNRLVQPFFGTLNIIDLDTYRFNKTKPAIVFNSVKVLEKEYVNLLEGNEPVLTLDHDQNYLQFEFAALVFNNSDQTNYACRLEGIDKDWIYNSNRNSVSYSGLNNGAYYFKVKAANNDGIWGDEKILKIIIRPPFYASWWFIAICLLFIGGLFFAWNRFRINQARKEEKIKATFTQQIAETEMKALRAQMNPHFIFNSLNSIQKYILKNDHFAASQYLTKFSRLIRLILDHSNQNNILLSSELELLKLYVEMESIRFDDKFNYEIKADAAINADTVEIPSMLIQPYVENAIWHGLLHKEEKGKLTINFLRNGGDTIKVIIEDDGIGREKAAELKSKQVLKKKSYGMQITEDRIAIINRMQDIKATSKVIDLKDAAGNAAGTRVILEIPTKPLTN